MRRIVTNIEPAAATALPKRKRVAAYARVSLGTEHMLHSLAAQVSYYSGLIQKNPEWEYAGVYADADETGTREDRPEFQRMLADCRAGRIDTVLTKSISRFARNTVTLLNTVRELKDIGIDVFFEEQSIHTLSGDGELMLTILASYAQEESRSVSENIKWRKRNDMSKGKTKPLKCYGYRVVDDKLAIVPEQAEVVRLIFELFLGGLGKKGIVNELSRRGIPSPMGKAWSPEQVRRVLTNHKMCGNLLHQRKYVVDHISKKQARNRGELPMYLIENTHEGIISKETFETVQAELARRDSLGTINESEGQVFHKMIVCGGCGRKFLHTSCGREVTKCRAWICGGRDKRTGANCKATTLPEPTLMKAAAEALGLETFDSEVFTERVEKVIAKDGRVLTFVFKDGAEANIQWHKRKPNPYSVIGKEKRQGRNICYSVIGKGNGKVGERRRKKEAERDAKRTSHTGE
jgi:DNA invertase Pin-like site-specific DNA recombinase